MAAYYGLAVMRDQYADRLEKGPVADEVLRLTSDEWLLEGAKAGHQVSGCRLSERYMRDYIEAPGEDKRPKLQRIAEIIHACLVKSTSPRAVILSNRLAAHFQSPSVKTLRNIDGVVTGRCS